MSCKYILNSIITINSVHKDCPDECKYKVKLDDNSINTYCESE